MASPNALPKTWAGCIGTSAGLRAHLRILSCAQVTSAAPWAPGLLPGFGPVGDRAIDTPVTGFSIIYGVSDNDRNPVDNSKAQHLGYRPKDNAEQFAADILAQEPAADPQDAAVACHGGAFAAVPIGNGSQYGHYRRYKNIQSVRDAEIGSTLT